MPRALPCHHPHRGHLLLPLPQGQRSKNQRHSVQRSHGPHGGPACSSHTRQPKGTPYREARQSTKACALPPTPAHQMHSHGDNWLLRAMVSNLPLHPAPPCLPSSKTTAHQQCDPDLHVESKCQPLEPSMPFFVGQVTPHIIQS